MATLRLKYPQYPKHIETIAQEVRDHVEAVRNVRIASGIKPPMKECRGCKQSLPRTTMNFVVRIRKGHDPYWYPFCRTCKRARMDRKAKVTHGL
jgi:RNase P subunit RPR2